jgi:phospholipid/cholesterol/gamma-HCH transport system substrate-binding protein
MENKVNYAAVGAFVIVLASVFVAGVLWIASGQIFKARQDLYVALVGESVAGLNQNAPVKYRGVDVGVVRDIRIDPANSEQVRLVFAIDRGTPVRVDTEATLKSQGLTGIVYVELSGGTKEAPLLKPGADGQPPLIKTKPSLGARIEEVLPAVLANIDKTMAGINAVFDEGNRAAFKRSLADISTIANTVAARKAEIDAAILAANRTMQNSARVTAQAGPVLDRVGKGADSVQQAANETSRMVAGAGRTVEEVGADIRRFTGETVPELERLMSELRVLSGSLRRLAEQIEGNPAGLLFGRTPVPEGPGETKKEAK